MADNAAGDVETTAREVETDPQRALSAQLGEALAEGILGLNSSEDLHKVARVQEELLQKLGNSNAALHQLNEHAAENLALASARFAKHTSVVTQLSADLMRAYKRIRQLKERLKASHPDAYAQACEGALRSPLGRPLGSVHDDIASGGRWNAAQDVDTAAPPAPATSSTPAPPPSTDGGGLVSATEAALSLSPAVVALALTDCAKPRSDVQVGSSR
jgi:hypothetical protein